MLTILNRYVDKNIIYRCTGIVGCLVSTGLYAGGHVESAYAYIRNNTPYTVALHGLQETQFVDKVPQVWYVGPGGTQMLGRLDTLHHMRLTGHFSDNSIIPESLRTMIDVPLPPRQKNKYLLITITLRNNDQWRIDTTYVQEVNTLNGGPSGYGVHVEMR